MSEFDDSVLRDQLQRLGGHGPDEDGAYLRLQQRVRIAKRRRAAAVIGGLGVTLMIGFAAGAYQSPSASHLAPADGGNDVFVTTSAVTESTESTSPTTDSVESTDAPQVTESSVANRSGGASGPSNTQNHSGPGKSGTSDTSSTTASTLQPPATTKSESTIAAVPPGVESRTVNSAGGSATVQLDKGSLSLVGTPTPAAGFTSNNDKLEADRIRITFHAESNGTSTTVHIEFTIGSDGHIAVDISS